ncbi:hypothetical protein D9M69_666500 [compost metagenome]
MTTGDNTFDLVGMSIQKRILICNLEPAMDFILLVQALLHCRDQWAKLEYFNGHSISLQWIFRELFDVRFNELTKFSRLGIGKQLG